MASEEAEYQLSVTAYELRILSGGFCPLRVQAVARTMREWVDVERGTLRMAKATKR